MPDHRSLNKAIRDYYISKVKENEKYINVCTKFVTRSREMITTIDKGNSKWTIEKYKGPNST